MKDNVGREERLRTLLKTLLFTHKDPTYNDFLEFVSTVDANKTQYLPLIVEYLRGSNRYGCRYYSK